MTEQCCRKPNKPIIYSFKDPFITNSMKTVNIRLAVMIKRTGTHGDFLMKKVEL